jgi:hypothetical protein
MNAYERFKTVSDTVADMVRIADEHGGVLDFKTALTYVNDKGVELFTLASAEDKDRRQQSCSGARDQGILQ